MFENLNSPKYSLLTASLISILINSAPLEAQTQEIYKVVYSPLTNKPIECLVANSDDTGLFISDGKNQRCYPVYEINVDLVGPSIFDINNIGVFDGSLELKPISGIVYKTIPTTSQNTQQHFTKQSPLVKN